VSPIYGYAGVSSIDQDQSLHKGRRRPIIRAEKASGTSRKVPQRASDPVGVLAARRHSGRHLASTGWREACVTSRRSCMNCGRKAFT
jgi:hypothetical protein